MIRKTKLVDWVRGLMNQASGLTGRPAILIELGCTRTGDRRVDRVGLYYWEDEDFRYGYEDMCREDGLVIVAINTSACGQTGYSESSWSWIAREPHNFADFAPSEFAVEWQALGDGFDCKPDLISMDEVVYLSPQRSD